MRMLSEMFAGNTPWGGTRVWRAALGLALLTTLICSASAQTPRMDVALTADVDGKAGYASGMGALAIPGQEITIRIAATVADEGARSGDTGPSATVAVAERFEWSVERGRLLNVTGTELTFRCPEESGTCHLKATYFRGSTIKGAEGEDITRVAQATWTLAVFVQFPFDREGAGTIEDYPIGVYPNEDSPSAPSTVLSHRDVYAPPKWFARVSADERDIPITPNFKIGEFCSPHSNPDPAYVAISPRLLTRLEATREELASVTRPDPRIVILRAFLSPNEKTQLERKEIKLSTYTRLLYGDGVAVIVDEDGDGKMDDLNGDGSVDIKDADYLSRVVEQVSRETKIFGGVGIYAGATDSLLPDTPYVAFDCRGWGVRY